MAILPPELGMEQFISGAAKPKSTSKLFLHLADNVGLSMGDPDIDSGGIRRGWIVRADNSATKSALFENQTSSLTEILRLRRNGTIDIGESQDDGGGERVITLQNAAVVPTSNPIGGVILYASGGQLFARSATGINQLTT